MKYVRRNQAAGDKIKKMLYLIFRKSYRTTGKNNQTYAGQEVYRAKERLKRPMSLKKG
jgi:hypothetical protein